MPVQTHDRNADDFVKPVLRGHLHQSAFFIALGACTMLIVESVGTGSLLGASIYSACLVGLFGMSALYHRPQWKPRQLSWMRRLDHSAIFLLIAGTMTPICLLGLSEESGKRLLILSWSFAAVGIVQSLLWLKASRWLTATLAIIMGWLAAPFVPEISNRLGWSSALFLIIGGVLYTVGAIIFAMKRPDPIPMFFGYHEIFHLLVIVAAIFHFVVIVRLAT